MLSLDQLRNNSEFIKERVARKKFSCDIDKFLEVDTKRRALISEFERLRASQKSANDEISSLKKGSQEFIGKVGALKELSFKIKDAEAAVKDIEIQWKALYLSIPNIPHESVPVGKSEKDNVVISTWGNVDEISKYAIPHFDIPWFSSAIDFQRGAKVTGAGFPFYVGDMARFVRSRSVIEENMSSGNITLSSTGIESKSAALWKIMPISRLSCIFSRFDIATKLRPSYSISPEVGSSRPTIFFIRTVFPEPLWPMMRLVLPFSNVALMSFRTSLSSKDL